jgi:hypothetical protein
MSFGENQQFLNAKVITLTARARRLSELTPEAVGIRKQDSEFAPSALHFKAANQRLAKIDQAIVTRLKFLKRQCRTAQPQQTLLYAAMVEREIDRARRAFGLFFEVFSQRGSAFAPVLAAHDVIASDCYQAVRYSRSKMFGKNLIKPLTYLEHGYSPATMRRGVTLVKLLGETNPFPLIRIPWDRDNPWQAVFLHEVSHNLQADLGLWQENKDAVQQRMLRAIGDPNIVSIYGRWHKEIFADLAAVLLGGPASVWGMMDFLAHPSPKVMTFKPGGAHPTGYLRVLVLAEMLERMGFEEESHRVSKVWKQIYRPGAGHRIPKRLLSSSKQSIHHIVDEIAFQPRRGLAQRSLADVIQFTPEHEKMIRHGSRQLVKGIVPNNLPPRFLVSASRHALTSGVSLQKLSNLVIRHLASKVGRKYVNRTIPKIAAA